VIEPRSATMKLGVHQQVLGAAVAEADQVLWYQNANIDWDLVSVAKAGSVSASVSQDIHSLLEEALHAVRDKRASGKPMHIVIMSNGGFEGFHQRFVERAAIID